MPRACVALLLALCASCCELCHAEDGTRSSAVLSASDSSLRKFEVGFDSAAIRTGYEGPSCCPVLALGIQASVNLNHRFSIDTKLLRTTSATVGATNVWGGHVTEFLSGPRAEMRSRRYGYFVSAQAGLLNWNHVITGIRDPASGPFDFTYGGRTNFVSETAAGFEFAATDRIRFRAHVGDLITRVYRSQWTNTLQPGVGMVIGVGRPIAWQPPAYLPKASHPFWDKWNAALVSAGVLAMTADSITTQRFIAHGEREGNPLAAPLVKYGWSGQASLEAMETGAVIMGIYGLHRIGHHWIERLVPCGVAAAHGILAFQNTRTGSRSGIP